MTLADFVLSLRQPGRLSLCPAKLRQALGMPRSQFARLIGVHRNSLSGGWKAEQGMARVVRALSAGYSLTGSMDDALLWFRRQPIPELGHRTPAELVAAGQVDEVVRSAEVIR